VVEYLLFWLVSFYNLCHACSYTQAISVSFNNYFLLFSVFYWIGTLPMKLWSKLLKIQQRPYSLIHRNKLLLHFDRIEGYC